MFNRKDYMKQWHEKNPEYMNKYRIENKDKIKEQVKIYYSKWCKNNPNYMKEYMRNYDVKKGREESLKKYRKSHIEEAREYRKKYNKNNRGRYNKDIKYNLNHKIRKAIRESLKGNKDGRHWEDLVGYTVNKLIKRLKKTMPKGFTWQDFLDGKLHIDHIVPISAYNFNSLNHIDFLNCWALKNLQLLPAKENMSKGCKLSRPFQPALAI